MSYFFCTVSDPWSGDSYLGMVASDEGFEYLTRHDVDLGLDPARRVDAYIRMSGRDANSLTLNEYKLIAVRSVPMQRVSAWVEVDTFEEAQEAILRVLDESHERRAMKRLEETQGRVVVAWEESRVWVVDADDPSDSWSAAQLQDLVLDAVADRSLDGPNGWLVRQQMGLAAKPGDELGFVHL